MITKFMIDETRLATGEMYMMMHPALEPDCELTEGDVIELVKGFFVLNSDRKSHANSNGGANSKSQTVSLTAWLYFLIIKRKTLFIPSDRLQRIKIVVQK